MKSILINNYLKMKMHVSSKTKHNETQKNLMNRRN